MFGLKQDTLAAIRLVLQRYAQVERAVIFGSRARGDFMPNSDIDLAVYCDNELPRGLYLDLDEAVGIYKVDVVNPNQVRNQKLRRRIAEQGVEIYVRPTGQVLEHEVKH